MVGRLIAVLLMALFITAIAALVFRRRGPWGTVWTFFLFLFLALWTVSIYIRNVGPVYWGIAWLPLLVSALIFALLLVSIIPDANQWRDESLREPEASKVSTVEEIRRTTSRPGHGGLFWLMIVILIIAIVVGMLNPQMAL